MIEHLISDRLDFSKCQAGTFTLERTAIGVASVIQTAVETMAERVEAKRIRLAVDCFPTIGNIYADRRRLIQVL